MRQIDRNKPVLVTGGTGYMASWIVKMLLEDGIDVHATVRDPSNDGAVRHLRKIDEAAGGHLTLFRADLLDPGCFDEPMKDCELVLHTASPFMIARIKDPAEQLIRPAKEGTRNVLEAVNRSPAVKRVVLTSSVVAVHGDNVDIKTNPRGIFTEEDWNTTSSPGHQPYPYSKTVAEREAWAMAGAQERWDLVTINPGLILGPSLSRRKDSFSIGAMIQFGDGTYKSGAPDLWIGVVDVRDVASAHIRAGYTPEASGRHILVSGEATLLDLSKILRKHFGDAYPFPRKQVPKFLFWMIAPMLGFTRKYVSRNVGTKIRFDNAYSRTDLGMTYIPIERTVADHFQQILDDGLVDRS